MQRGHTDAETCRLNGWTVGTRLIGTEHWPSGGSVTTVIRLTAVGEAQVLARCETHNDEPRDRREGNWTLKYREWSELVS